MRILAVILCALLALAARAAEPVTLRYSVMDGPNSIDTIRTIVREFEAANPDIKVEIEQVADEYFMRLLTQYAAGVAPDLAQMNVGMYQPFAMRGALEPLGDYVARTPDIDLKRWYPNMVEFFSYQGELYGLPRDVSPFGLIFYNKTIFRQKGLELPDGSWTWSYQPRPELRERCFTWVMQQLTERNGKKTTRYGFAPAWPQLYFYLLLTSRHLTLWDSNEAPTKVTANARETIELMEFARRTIIEDNWIPSWYQIDTEAQSTAYDEFVKGKIAMLLTFSSDIGRLRKDMAARGWDWDVTVFPAYEGMSRATKPDGSGTVIFSTSKHKEEAWRFAAWMAGEKGQRHIALSGAQPAIRDLTLEPGLWLPGPDTPSERRKPENLSITDAAALAMTYDQTPEYFEDTRLYLDQAAFDILSGTKPPRETMERVTVEGQQRLDAALRKMPKDPFPMGWALFFAGLICVAVVAWIYLPERKTRYTRREKSESRSAYRFIAPLLFGLVVFTLGPILYSLILSFSNSDIIRPPMWRGVQNYVDAFTVDPVFLQSMKVTATYALMSVPVSMLFALSLALLLNQRVRGIPIFRAMYYIPSLVSGVATSLIWMRVFNPESGILNNLIYGADGSRNLLGLGSALSSFAGAPGQPVNWLANEKTVLPAFVIMGLWGAGGGTIIFLAGLQGISQTYYEAATLDGAGAWHRFKAVTLPMLSPAMFFALITGSIGALQAFTQAFVMTSGGPNNATMFYMLNLYMQGFKSLKMGYASALAWILFLVIFVITLVQLAASKRWVYYEGAER